MMTIKIVTHHVEPAALMGNTTISMPYRIEAMTTMYLNGAKFSTPSSDMVETKAMGLGTMPLIINLYRSLISICALSSTDYQ